MLTMSVAPTETTWGTPCRAAAVSRSGPAVKKPPTNSSANSVVDQKLGAYIGLLCAVGIALGGYEQMLEERARRARAAPGSRAARRVSARGAGRS